MWYIVDYKWVIADNMWKVGGLFCDWLIVEYLGKMENFELIIFEEFKVGCDNIIVEWVDYKLVCVIFMGEIKSVIDKVNDDFIQ